VTVVGSDGVRHLADRWEGELPEKLHGDANLRGALAIKIAWLRSFLGVAERGGFGAATGTLHLSQSRVSAHISALENALGVKLFERGARPTTLTPAGEIFKAHAEEALHELQAGVAAARAASRPEHMLLAVGSYPSVSSVFLPGVLVRLKEEHPEISVDLVEGTALALESALANGAVDVALRPLLPVLRVQGFSGITLWREAIVAVLRADDSLATEDVVRVRDLAARPLIGNPSGAPEEGGGFDLRHAAGDAAAELNVAYLTDQPATLVALVRAAFGVGVISQLALATTSIEGLVVRPIESPTAFRDVAVVWRERRCDDPTLRAFLAAVRRADLPDGVVPPHTA
jgi:LysR family carnitine catabolism transcriptional activator